MISKCEKKQVSSKSLIFMLIKQNTKKIKFQHIRLMTWRKRHLT